MTIRVLTKNLIASYSSGTENFISIAPHLGDLWFLSNTGRLFAYSSFTHNVNRIVNATLTAPYQLINYANGLFEAGNVNDQINYYNEASSWFSWNLPAGHLWSSVYYMTGSFAGFYAYDNVSGNIYAIGAGGGVITLVGTPGNGPGNFYKYGANLYFIAIDGTVYQVTSNSVTLKISGFGLGNFQDNINNYQSAYEHSGRLYLIINTSNGVLAGQLYSWNGTDASWTVEVPNTVPKGWYGLFEVSGNLYTTDGTTFYQFDSGLLQAAGTGSMNKAATSRSPGGVYTADVYTTTDNNFFSLTAAAASAPSSIWPWSC